MPNKDRPNLTVLVAAHVNRVVPSMGTASSFIAEGVEFEHEGQTYIARAAKEVILSAGSVTLCGDIVVWMLISVQTVL